ncbi:hypothetical protein YC2023_079568 [Brassica napus]
MNDSLTTAPSAVRSHTSAMTAPTAEKSHKLPTSQTLQGKERLPEMIDATYQLVQDVAQAQVFVAIEVSTTISMTKRSNRTTVNAAIDMGDRLDPAHQLQTSSLVGRGEARPHYMTPKG